MTLQMTTAITITRLGAMKMMALSMTLLGATISLGRKGITLRQHMTCSLP